MKKILSLLVAPLFMSAFSTGVSAGVGTWEYGPYIGVDVHVRHIRFGKNLGDNLFQKNYAQGNPFIGVRFNDFIGVEIGYEETIKKNSTPINGPGSIELGDMTPGGVFHYSNNTFRMRGPNANLIGYLPFCVCDEKFDFFASVGVAYLKAKSTHQITAVSVDGVIIPLTAEQMLESKIKFNKRRTVLRATTGLQYMINCNAGVRATFGWENTNKFRNLPAHNPIMPNQRATLKNSFLYGLGIFWQF